MNNQENEQLTPEKVFEAALKSELITEDDIEGRLNDPTYYVNEIHVLASSLMCGIVNDVSKDPVPYISVFDDYLKYVKFKMNLSK